MTSDENIESFRKLLEGMDNLTPVEVSPPTFLEIPGRSHLEVVLAKYLQFFLDPTEQHELGSVFADALLMTYGIDEPDSAVQEVLVEVRTDKNNRIDLVLLEDSRVTKVELKVFADLTNPLDDYAAYWNSDWGADANGMDKINILLAPGAWVDRYPSELRGGFKVCALPEFAETLTGMLGRYAQDANPVYWQLMLDLLRTITNYDMRSSMNLELAKLLTDNDEATRGFLREVWGLNKQMKKEVAEIAQRFGATYLGALDSYNGARSANSWIGASATTDFRTNGGDLVRAGIVLEPHGWSLELTPENGSIRSLAAANLWNMIDKYGVADAWREKLSCGYRRHRLGLNLDASFEEIRDETLEVLKPFGLVPVPAA